MTSMTSRFRITHIVSVEGLSSSEVNDVLFLISERIAAIAHGVARTEQGHLERLIFDLCRTISEP